MEPGNEMRIIVKEANASFRILKNGGIACNGMPMRNEVEYPLTIGSHALYAFRKSSIVLTRCTGLVHTRSAAPFLVARAKEVADIKDSAAKRGQAAPTVMITGAPDSGKRTLAHFLLNVSAIKNGTPLFVDLDPSVDGSITAMDFVNPSHSSLFRYDNATRRDVYFIGGSISSKETIPVFSELTSSIAKSVADRKSSEVILLAPKTAAVAAANVFKPDVIYVLNDDPLAFELGERAISLPVLEGALARTRAERRAESFALVKTMFTGFQQAFVVDFSGTGPHKSIVQKLTFHCASDPNWLPIGATAKLSAVEQSLSDVKIVDKDIGTILAVLGARGASGPIAGFVYVSAVDGDKVSLIWPGTSLDYRSFLIGSIKYSF